MVSHPLAEPPPAPRSLRAWLRGRKTLLAGAYLLYVSIHTVGVLSSPDVELRSRVLGLAPIALDEATRWALLFSVLHCLPEVLAAPFVLDLAASSRVASAAPRRRAAIWMASLVAFVVWAILGSQFTNSVLMFLREGIWKLTLFDASAVWKTLWSLIAFAALAGLGSASARARETRAAEARAQRAETLRAEARLAVLRAQLNPHFILNLLHSLMGMVGRDPKTAAAALERLGGLLQHALRVQRQEADEIPLRDELAFVEDYLALERLRLADRLRADVQVDPGALDAAVPAFVLQPLVENAVRHGVAPRAEGGRLAVSVRSVDGTLRLRVEDDGTGPVAGATGGEGLGLRLIEERLAAMYGPAASLHAGAMAGGGFAAEVVLPRARPAEEETP